METTTIHSRAGNATVTLRKPIEHLQEVWARGEFFEQRLLEYIYWHYKGGVFVDVGSAIGTPPLLTYPANDPIKQIDYIWASPDLVYSDFQIQQTTASDHLPIAATISLP